MAEWYNASTAVRHNGRRLNGRMAPEEVRHGDVTAGVKSVWNVITTDGKVQ